MCHLAKFNQNWSNGCTDMWQFNGHQNSGCSPSWFCWARIGTNHNGYLVVFIVVQILVEINVVISIL